MPNDAPAHSRRAQSAPKATARAPRRTQAERSEATKLKILNISAQLLRKTGVGGMSTSEVAALAGVSQGAQFHHFPTKQKLIIATLEHVNAQALGVSRKRASAPLGTTDQIAQIMDDASDYFFSDYFFAELSIGLSGDDQELLAEIRARTKESRLLVETAWRDSLQAAGLPPELASDVLALTLSVVRGFAVRTLINPDQRRYAHLYAVWQDIIKAYLETALATADVPAKPVKPRRPRNRR